MYPVWALMRSVRNLHHPAIGYANHKLWFNKMPLFGLMRAQYHNTVVNCVVVEMRRGCIIYDVQYHCLLPIWQDSVCAGLPDCSLHFRARGFNRCAVCFQII